MRKVFRRTLYVTFVCIGFLALLEGRSTGIGVSTYTHSGYYSYFVLALTSFLMFGWLFKNLPTAAILFALFFIFSHAACWIEEERVIRNGLRNPSVEAPRGRLFDSSCWIFWNPVSGKLEAGD